MFITFNFDDEKYTINSDKIVTITFTESGILTITFEDKNVSDQSFRAITMFLPRGREAVLQVPRPFYESDKEAIKKQLEAIFTDDEDTNE